MITFIMSAFSNSVWADCVFLPEKKCVNLQFVEVVTIGKEEMCLGKVINLKDKSEERVFFLHCPKKGSFFSGNLVQRSDMTLEGMASCRYEVKTNSECN
ncbi:MAG: hypothetical protein K2Q18_12520 [Bdellovibrionales bacterium]|nr:hypothetical protein [Bdellovibrionales bacterium]